MIELTKQDKIAWRRFIGSEPGMNGMLWLRENIPGIFTGPEHEIVFNAGRSEGFKAALDKISETLILREPEDQNADNP
jgi:hypothetical protein